MIKFGIMAMPQHPTTDSPTQRFQETVELTRLARDAGFHSIACGQHFLSPPNPVPAKSCRLIMARPASNSEMPTSPSGS